MICTTYAGVNTGTDERGWGWLTDHILGAHHHVSVIFIHFKYLFPKKKKNRRMHAGLDLPLTYPRLVSITCTCIYLTVIDVGFSLIQELYFLERYRTTAVYSCKFLNYYNNNNWYFVSHTPNEWWQWIHNYKQLTSQPLATLENNSKKKVFLYYRGCKYGPQSMFVSYYVSLWTPWFPSLWKINKHNLFNVYFKSLTYNLLANIGIHAEIHNRKYMS